MIRKQLVPRLVAMCLLCVIAPVCMAQEAPPLLKLEQAVELALKNYPSIRAARAQKAAADAGVELSRTHFLPRADLLWQQNRATRNNVFGLLLPQSTLPLISGPLVDEVTMGSAWGSAGGLLVSWEPFDFGLRKAQVDLARQATRQAEADEAVTRLEVSAAVADAFLALLANEQAVHAAAANVERAETLAKAVRVLVENQLRPGVDASRSEAELAAARNQLILTEQNAELARANLAESIGQGGANLAIEQGRLLNLPPALLPAEAQSTLNFSLHPLAIAQTAAIDTVRAREKLLDRSFFPKFNWQSAIYGRGSSALLTGRFDNGKGFYPDTMNWATGMTMSFSISDIFGLRSKRRIESNHAAAEQARYDQVINTLKAQDSRARTLIESARKIAGNTPVQLKAARETLERARVRYEYGLTNITEVAEAQSLLARAEIDDAVAKLSVWRALLVAAKLQGDLKPFLDQTKN